MTRPAPRKVGKALPPKGPAVVYVALHSGGYLSFFIASEDAKACLRRHGDPEDRIAEYVPRKAGARRAR